MRRPSRRVARRDGALDVAIQPGPDEQGRDEHRHAEPTSESVAEPAGQAAHRVAGSTTPARNQGDRDRCPGDIGRGDRQCLEAGPVDRGGRDDPGHDRPDARGPEQADGRPEDHAAAEARRSLVTRKPGADARERTETTFHEGFDRRHGEAQPGNDKHDDARARSPSVVSPSDASVAARSTVALTNVTPNPTDEPSHATLAATRPGAERERDDRQRAGRQDRQHAGDEGEDQDEQHGASIVRARDAAMTR